MTAPLVLVLAPAHVQVALLAVIRLSGMLWTSPPFHTRTFPIHVRVGLAFALTLVAWTTISTAPPAMAGDVLTLTGLAAGELGIGLAIGSVARLVVTAASFAAEVVGTQIGFGIAALLDPMQGAPTSPLARLYDWTMLALFLTLDAHHLVIGAAVQSLRAIPVGVAPALAAGSMSVVAFAGRVFSLGLGLVAPTIGLLLLTNIVLVVAARAMPQLSLMSVAWPITVLVGITALLLNLDVMSGVVAQEFERLEPELTGLVRSLAGG
jgi:flagellar biosynthesis protein FliR